MVVGLVFIVPPGHREDRDSERVGRGCSPSACAAITNLKPGPLVCAIPRETPSEACLVTSKCPAWMWQTKMQCD